MAKDRVEVLFSCVVCGQGFSSKQALRGHMNAHRGQNYRTTHIVVDGEVWDRFVGLCRRHKTTTCQLLRVLMKAALKGDETGMIDIGSANPMVVNIQEVFLGKPRSPWEVEVDLDRVRGLKRRCPWCGSTDIYEFQPTTTNYQDGRCRMCGARWLIAPGSGSGSAVLPTRGG